VITKSVGSAGSATFFANAYTGNLRLNNTGVINVNAGVLRVENSGAHEGTLNLATNTVLYMAGGSHTFGTNSHLIGEGTLEIAGGGVTFLGEYRLTGGTTLRGGGLNFSNATNELANFTMTGGTLSGSSEIVVTNAASWTAGTIVGEGRFVVATNVEFTISSVNDHNLARVFVNRGTVRWNNGRILANGSVIENLAGALWSIDCDSYFYDGVFNNAGTVIKTAAPSNDATYFANAYTGNLRFNNAGLLQLDAGVIRFDNHGAHSGGFDLKTNTVMILNGGTHSFAEGATISGDGELRLNTGAISADGTGLALPKFTFNNGVLTGPAAVTLTKNSIWSAGNFGGTGPLIVPLGVTLTIANGNDRGLSRTVDNFGSIRWEGGRIFANGATVNIKSGAIWDIACDSNFYDGVVNNEGVIQKTASTGETYFENYQGAVRLNNAGILNLQAGTMRLRNSGSHAGIFQVGSGTTFIFEGGAHTFGDGTAFGGLGTIRIWQPITLGADLPCSTATVIFENAASISGAFNMSNEPGGGFLFAKSMNIPGSMTIGGSIATGSASVQVILGGDLTLLAGSLVENPGLIQAANVIDQGATISGNAPIETPIAPSLRIDTLQVSGAATGKTKAAIAPAGSTISLVFSATTTARVAVETSTDLVHWTETPCQIAPISGGKFEARVSTTDGSLRWFRLRQIP
jgi:hypothetical protein